MTGCFFEVGIHIQIDPYEVFSKGIKLNYFFFGVVRWLGKGPRNEVCRYNLFWY